MKHRRVQIQSTMALAVLEADSPRGSKVNSHEAVWGWKKFLYGELEFNVYTMTLKTTFENISHSISVAVCATYDTK